MGVILENSRTTRERLGDKPMPDEPKQKPTFEDLVRDFGYDKMVFFSDMMRPDQREEDANLPTALGW